MKIYLAGPIFQCEDHECIDWRQEIKKSLPGVESLDLMERDYRGKPDEFIREIVEDNKAHIDRSDIRK